MVWKILIMELNETLFKKSFSVDSENPHITAMDFMKKLSEYYRVYEQKNAMESDGPEHKSTLVFDVVDTLDDFSHVSINFSMIGEGKTLYVDIFGSFVLRVRDDGFFTEIFAEFYLNNIFPVMRRVSEARVKELEVELDRL
jgi:hypothetical protein